MNKMKSCVLPGRNPGKEIRNTIIFGVLWVLITDIPRFFLSYKISLLFIGETDYSFNPFDFNTLSRGALFGVVIYSFYRICKAIYDMGYFNRGTKSIYVMRRLDESMPIVKRAWTKALIGIAAAFVAAVIMFYINYLVYRTGTPEAYITDIKHLDFWGAIL